MSKEIKAKLIIENNVDETIEKVKQLSLAIEELEECINSCSNAKKLLDSVLEA